MTKKKTASKKLSRPSVNRLLPISTSIVVITLAIIAYFVWLNTQSTTKLTKVNVTPTPATVQLTQPIALPKPSTSGKMSVEATMFNRRSRRDFVDSSLSLKQIGQMLWAAQGVTVNWGGRTAPSAKSAYPLTLYLAVYKVEGLAAGIYKYIPGDRDPVHQVVLTKSGELKSEVAGAIGQNAASNPPAIIMVTGDMDKMAKAFNNTRVDNNVYLEAGHAAQNLYLQAESLGLGMVTIAGFSQDKVKSVMGLPGSETVIYAIPFGIPKK